jgi:hypothetical protein
MIDLAEKPHYSTGKCALIYKLINYFIVISNEVPDLHRRNVSYSRVYKLQEVERENHKLLKRLQKVGSHYHVAKWEAERRH